MAIESCDPRINTIRQLVSQLAARSGIAIEEPDQRDEITGIIDDLAAIVERRERWQLERDEIETRVKDLTATIAAIAPASSGLKTQTATRDDRFDVIAAGLNTIIEAFRGSVVSRDYLFNITNSMLDSLIITDMAGRITLVNAAACRLLGYQEHELLTHAINDLFVEPFRLDGTEAHDLEERTVITRDGHHTLVSCSISPLFNRGGQPEGFICVAQDITERKKAQDELWQSRYMLQLILDHMPSAVIWKDRNGVYMGCNRRQAAVVGMASPEAIIGLTDYDLNISPDIAAAYRLDDQLVMDSDTPKLNYEEQALSPDGPLRWLRTSKVPLHDAAGQVIGVLVVFDDITERKQAEQTLQMFRYSIDQATDAIFWMTRDAGFAYVNEQACRSLGYSREELLNLRLWDINPVFPKELWESGWQRMHDSQQTSNEPSETLHRRKDGTVFPVEVSARHLWLGDEELHVAVARDITTRKQQEAALRESETRYRALIESQTDLISRYRPDTVLTFVNDAYCKFYGKTREELIGQSFLMMVAPEFHSAVLHETEDIAKNPRLVSGEYVNYSADGKEHWINWVIQGITDESGQVIEIQAIGHDITQLKQATDALRESEFFLQKSQAVGRIGSYYLDIRAGTWIDSPMLDEIFGIDDRFHKDTEGWLSLVHPDQKEEMRHYLSQHVLVDHHRFDKEYRIVRYDNQRLVWVHGLGELEFDEQGNPSRMIGTIQDITDRKQIQQELLLTQFSVDQASIGIMRTGAEAQILSANQHICQLLGYTVQELCSLHIYDIDPNFPIERWKQHRRLIARQGSDTFETAHRRKDGTLFPVEVTSTYILFQDNEFAVSFIRDITERKQQEAALRRYNQRLSLLRDMDRLILKAHSAAEVVSAVLEQLAQLIACDWIGAAVFDDSIGQYQLFTWQAAASQVSVHDPQPIIPDVSLDRLKSGQSVVAAKLTLPDVQHHVLAKELTQQGLHAVMANPLNVYGRLLGCLVLASRQEGFFGADYQQLGETVATQAALALHRAELNERLAQQNLELEQRVAERTQELQEANEEIRQFAYIVSHDLRAPLVNLKGFAAELRAALKDVEAGYDEAAPLISPTLRDKLTRALQDDIPEALRFIESSVSNMDTFTKAILKLSRLGRVPLELSRIEVNSIVGKILDTLSHQIKQQGVRVTVGDLPVITADLVSMEQIFGNILTNAVLYLVTDRPGEIEISAEETADETIFHIRDNGRGIAKEDMDKVFAPFRRAGRQNVPGEGMGLAYVQALVRKHGGRIWCESEIGVGTTFTFSVPRNVTNDD